MTGLTDDDNPRQIYLQLWMAHRLLRPASDADLEAAGTSRDQLGRIVDTIETELLPYCFKHDAQSTVKIIQQLALCVPEHSGVPS